MPISSFNLPQRKSSQPQAPPTLKAFGQENIKFIVAQYLVKAQLVYIKKLNKQINK